MQGRDIILVGGGNSAGQAAAFFADYARSVTILIRGESLDASMSRYLIDELERKPNVARPHRRRDRALRRRRRGSSASSIRNRADGSLDEVDAHALFIFIGADANTGWLPEQIICDERGFICTGRDVTDLMPEAWPLERDPYLLETSVPGHLLGRRRAPRQHQARRLRCGRGQHRDRVRARASGRSRGGQEHAGRIARPGSHGLASGGEGGRNCGPVLASRDARSRRPPSHRRLRLRRGAVRGLRAAGRGRLLPLHALPAPHGRRLVAPDAHRARARSGSPRARATSRCGGPAAGSTRRSAGTAVRPSSAGTPTTPRSCRCGSARSTRIRRSGRRTGRSSTSRRRSSRSRPTAWRGTARGGRSGRRWQGRAGGPSWRSRPREPRRRRSTSARTGR